MLSPLVLALVGCLKTPGTPAHFVVNRPLETSSQALLCDDPTLEQDDFCMVTNRERLLRTAPLTFLTGEVIGEGASGVMKMRVQLEPDDGPPLVLDTKWKPGPKQLSGLNNSPRKEVAAYQVQKLFLPEDRYVVPPTVMRCEPTLPNTLLSTRAGGGRLPCVWGVLSQWVDNVEAPEVIDRARLETDDAYRLAMADLNLLMIVISHRDTHAQNWMLSTDPDRVRAVSVDNGIAFSGLKNPNLDVDWSAPLFQAYPADAVEALRGITPADLETFAVLGAWRVQGDHLVPTEPVRPPKRGVRLENGVLVHGLQQRELDMMYARIQAFLQAVDDGHITTFDVTAPVAELE